MQNPLRKLGQEVPEPPKSGEVLKSQKTEKPTLLKQVLEDVFTDKSEVREKEVTEPLVSVLPLEDMGMEVDVPAVDLDGRNFLQKFWTWLRGDNNHKHLMCVQKTAMAKRKLGSMRKEALSVADKVETVQIKEAAAIYEDLWKYLAKHFQGRGMNLGDDVAWDEFLFVLHENDQAKGLGKFPGTEQIKMLLRKYHKDRDVMRLLFSKVIKQEFNKLALLLQTEYFDQLKHPFKYIVMSQLAPRNSETIARALKIFMALPKDYPLNHTRTFGIIQFAEFSTANQITPDIVEAAMQAGLDDEQRVAIH